MPHKKTASVQRIPVKPSDRMANGSRVGVKSSGVKVGGIDKQRDAERRREMGGNKRRNKTAGQMMGYSPQPISWPGGFYTDAYRSSYASGSRAFGGTYDVPTYFVLMNENNGGVIYWPVTLRERYSWFRYFVNTDAFIGRSMELICDLPLSKITLNMPKMDDKKLRQEILDFYTDMIDKIKLFKNLQDILWEYNSIGACYTFAEWSDETKSWDRLVILPPEEISVFQIPFTDFSRIEYRPERLIELIKASAADGSGPTMSTINDVSADILQHVPQEIIDMVQQQGSIIMDNDPTTGSFCYHFARRKTPYMELGVSILERLLLPMLLKENYRYTQLSIANRNMTPKSVVVAPGLSEAELSDLRTQVDLSYSDPDYAVVVNYDMTWTQLGAENRLLDLSNEYDRIESQVFAGMGTTKELLTGEGLYSGGKITVEILNSMFMMTREMLKDYVETQLFRPVAEAHGWYTVTSMGNKKYWHPKMSFNRLTIRDNAEVFDSLFQLYQKGSIPIDTIYELLNLNTEDMKDRLMADVFTVKDANFNRVLEEASTAVGQKLVDETDLTDRIIKELKLGPKPSEQPAEGEEGGGEMPELPEEPKPEEKPAGEEPAEEVTPEEVAEEAKLPPEPETPEVEPAAPEPEAPPEPEAAPVESAPSRPRRPTIEVTRPRGRPLPKITIERPQ